MFPIIPWERLEPSSLPQSLRGVAYPLSAPLKAPISGQQCIAYGVRVSEWTYVDDRWIWESRIVEERSVDFYLVDTSNSQQRSLLVPASTYCISVASPKYTTAESGRGRVSMFEHEELPPNIKVS